LIGPEEVITFVREEICGAAGVVVVGAILFGVISASIDLRGFQSYEYNPDCTSSSVNRYSRECEFFTGIPEEQTFVCASIEHCCYMTVRCFGFLFANAVDMSTMTIHNPLSNATMLVSEVEEYHNACPYTKCNSGFSYGRLCKGNPDGGYQSKGTYFTLDKYSYGIETGPTPCDVPGTCELALPYTSTVLSHTPYDSLGDCLLGLRTYEGGNTRNCMRRFEESHRRCLKFAIAYLQGGNQTNFLG